MSMFAVPDSDVVTTTRVIAEAQARAPRRPAPRARRERSGEETPPSPLPELENNYVAEERCVASVPGEAAKKRPGASPGNRNAIRHGRYSAETRARKAGIDALIRQSRNLIVRIEMARASRRAWRARARRLWIMQDPAHRDTPERRNGLVRKVVYTEPGRKIVEYTYERDAIRLAKSAVSPSFDLRAPCATLSPERAGGPAPPNVHAISLDTSAGTPHTGPPSCAVLPALGEWKDVNGPSSSQRSR
jgi:hypothetical protein